MKPGEIDLEMVERHIAEGERLIERQHATVADLERTGSNTAEAKALLATFYDVQALHHEHLDRLRAKAGLSNM